MVASGTTSPKGYQGAAMAMRKPGQLRTKSRTVWEVTYRPDDMQSHEFSKLHGYYARESEAARESAKLPKGQYREVLE